jgi:hypothetical protein
MTTVNITVANDADFYRTFQYCTVDTLVPIDISNSEMEMMLRRHASDKAAVLRLGTDTGEIQQIDPTNGIFTIRIEQVALERLGLGDFDQSLIMIRGPGKLRIWSGKLTNNAGPTR